MINLKINEIAVSVAEGATVLDAAEMIGVEIPTLCHLKGDSPETSCMLCVVKNISSGQLVPACSARAADGMEIDTECDEVQSARRDILNLLLSEHVGDCQAPCQRICPAHLDIPLMLREIQHGNTDAAAWIARRDLAIPVALGYICPAPCEKGCRRAQVDSAITIREMHKQAAKNGSLRVNVTTNECSVAYPKGSDDSTKKTFPMSGKTAAVIGSGAAGLSSAWKLCQLGYNCTVFDEAAELGGSLRSNPDLPAEVLDAEIEWLKSAGIKFELSASPNPSDFDAVVEPEEHKIAVMAVAKGKAAALAAAGVSEPAHFDSKVGKLRESEAQEFVRNEQAGMPAPQVGQASLPAQVEAQKCLHCDCRKPESCKLRLYADRYGADQREFPADERKHIELIGQDGNVVFEPGKCIKCGLCVRITKRAGEALGLTFMGRGFNTQVKVPFGESLGDGLTKAATECVAACPTGALAFKDGEGNSIAEQE